MFKCRASRPFFSNLNLVEGSPISSVFAAKLATVMIPENAPVYSRSGKVISMLGTGLLVLVLSLATRLAAEVSFDHSIPQIAFAAQELVGALQESEQQRLRISITVEADAARPEAFEIRSSGSGEILITGTDAKGAMYGGLEVADRLRLGLALKEGKHEPFIKKRGIKFNIPLDARTPSYDDTGDSAQRNIETMWDFEFWASYLDELARNRYNVLSLWTTHPFPSLIKLEDYPDVALDDVYRISDGVLRPEDTNKFKDIDFEMPGVLQLVKKAPIEEKIRHWQRVFQHAEDRGIEIFFFTWNVFTWYAEGKYGITQEQDNPRTIEYTRACVRKLLETYPQISGIGVCAGENADWYREGDRSIESFIFETFGKGIMDVQADDPDREMRFIFRRHVTDHPEVTRAFAGYTGGIIDTSIKYAVAHLYSSRRPQEWETRIVGEGWLEKYQAWLNLRNDDIFLHRWGSPDFVREFIRWMPHDDSPGFLMGSDGYVWARDYTAKNPDRIGRMEVDKHWYCFRLWGQLAYNNDLGRDYWEAALQHRFPSVDVEKLYDAWASTSEIVPQLNRSSWSPTDAAFSAEGVMERDGFLTIENYYFNRDPMVLNRIENAPDPQCISVTAWAKAMLAGKAVLGVTPLQVAENLDGYAAKAHALLPELRQTTGGTVELEDTLNDIDSMAYLGRYYADKIRGAAKLALYRASGRKEPRYLDQAVAHLEDAVVEWKAYAQILDRQYQPSLLARTNYLDWNQTLLAVEKEVRTVKAEGDYPQVRIANLSDGDRLANRGAFRVEVVATDGDGAPRVWLYLNGKILKAHATAPWVWSAQSDEMLKNVEPGTYHLEAVAEDVNGFRSKAEIQVVVGPGPLAPTDAWRNEIHQVILHEGETFEDGALFDFPRLRCFLTLEEDGRLTLFDGSPRDRAALLWATRGKADRPTVQPVPFRFYTALERGQIAVYRGLPGAPDTLLWGSGKTTLSGSAKLGLTVDRRLVVFDDANGVNKVIWKSPVRN